MANIKLKNAQGQTVTYNGVAVIKVKDTDDNDVTFMQNKGIVVIYEDVSGNEYAITSVPSGTSVQAPQEPARSGYIFRGWSAVSHEYIAGNKIAFPHLFTESTTIYAMWEEQLTQGQAQISGLGSEILTDVTFNISSDFPTTYTQVTDDNGDVWIQIPTCYRKVVTTTDGQIVSKIVSFTQVDSSYVPYSVFKKPNGDIMPYVRIGKYCMTSSTTAQSKSGTVQSFNIGAARTLARAKGNGYQLYDWQFRELFNDLAMIKQQSVMINLTTIIGIEYWNNYIWIDGFCHNNANYLVCYDPSKYIDNPTSSSDGYSQLSYNMPTSNGYIKKLGYDINHPFALFPSAIGGSSGTYYPDQQYYASGNKPVYCLVGSANAGSGLFYFLGDDAWSTAFSCRLCYRPI